MIKYIRRKPTQLTKWLIMVVIRDNELVIIHLNTKF